MSAKKKGPEGPFFIRKSSIIIVQIIHSKKFDYNRSNNSFEGVRTLAACTM